VGDRAASVYKGKVQPNHLPRVEEAKINKFSIPNVLTGDRNLRIDILSTSKTELTEGEGSGRREWFRGRLEGRLNIA